MGIDIRIAAGITVVLSFWTHELAAQSVAADAEALVRQGDRLAKQKRYNDALVAFKSADRLHPRAEHDCWVALAYARLKQATQANFFISRCKERAGSKRPIPWYPKAKRLAEQMLQRGEYALVTVVVKQAGAKLRPAMFDADEWLASPARLWLPVGRHGIDAKSASVGTKRAFVEVVDDRKKTVRIDLSTASASAGRPQLKFPSLRKAKPKPPPPKPKKASEPVAEKRKSTPPPVPDAPPPPIPEAAPPPVPKAESVPPPSIASNSAPPPVVTGDAPPKVDIGKSESSTQEDTEGSILPVIGWAAVGVGALALGSSAYLYTLGDTAARNADATLDKTVRETELSNYSSYSVMTYAAYGVGGAMLGVGAGLLVVDALSGSDAPKAQVAVSPTLGGALVQWSGRF